MTESIGRLARTQARRLCESARSVCMPVPEQTLWTAGSAVAEAAPDFAVPDAAVPVAAGQRQCGRCRGFFAAEPGFDALVPQDWWACPPCRAALFPAKDVASC
jgi:hypothetical protein